MGAELVRRQHRPTGKPVIPSQMYDKDKWSLYEFYYVYGECVDLAVATSLAAFFVTSLCTDGKTIIWPWPLIGLGVSIIIFIIAGLLFIFEAKDGWSDTKKRKSQITLNRHRLCAGHADERVNRACDVDYSQFSIWVSRRGGDMTVAIRRHFHGVGNHIWTGVDEQSEGYDATNGIWGNSEKKDPKRPWLFASGPNKVRITEPTLDRVASVVEDMAAIAAIMERNSYERAFEDKKIERLEQLFKAPPSGARDQAIALADEMENLDIEAQLRAGR